MKPIRFSKFLAQSTTLRSFRLALAAPALVITLTSAQAGTSAKTPVPAETPAPLTSWIGFTIGGAFVNGNDAGFMSRAQQNDGFYGGIDSLQYSKAINDSTTLTMDGHALPGLEDYEVNIDVTKTDLGYIKTGYKEFRTWYDGTGGFSEGKQYSLPAWGEELSVDRGEFYLEAGLRMENMPEITFSYKHAFRNGQKDSLAWGEGIPSNIANTFKTAPALWDIDEQSDTFELDVAHTLGNTDLGLGLVYEHASYTNSRTNTRGYLITSPPATSSSAFREVTLTDEYSMDLFAGNIHSVTRFNDKLWLTAGFAYNSVNTDTDGSTRSIASNTPLYTGTRAEAYAATSGGGEVSQIIGNLNLMWNPMPDLTITPSLRYEHEERDALSTNPFYRPQTPAVLSYASAADDSELNETIGALDIRYTGLSDLVLYAKGQWGQTNEDVTWRDTSKANLTPRSLVDNDIQIDEQEYTLGANWYPLSGLSFSLQGFYAERDQSLDPTGNAGTGVQTLGTQGMTAIMLEHDTQIEDINLRMTWRPLSNLSLVTRYDYGQTKYSNRGSQWEPGAVGSSPSGAEILNFIESGKTTCNILSESVTWNPMARLYVQGSASWVWSQTDSDFTSVTNSDNDYFSGSLTAGYAIDDKTDLTGSFTYYGASNYAAAASSMGYGLNTQEYGASLTLTRMITANMVWNLRYAFLTSQTDPSPDQSGGYNDFTAQMVSTGLQIRF